MAEEMGELPEATVAGVQRNPGILKRMARAPMHLASGTFLPRLQGILNPSLYMERGDTSRLMDDIFTEGGALERLAAANPALAQEIRQQSETPMSVGEHRRFRSAILGMVEEEVARESKIQYRLADNANFMEAFRAMDAAIPGARDPERFTFEEAERRQVDILFRQAQEMATIDPDGSAAIMAEARKKADSLTSSVRTQMEQIRKAARVEDSALAVNTRNASQLVGDALQELRSAIAEKGVSDVPDHVLQRAMQAYGTAGQVALTNVGDVVASGALGAAGGLAGGPAGALVSGAVAAAGGIREFFKGKEKVLDLERSLAGMQEQFAANYQANRAALQERYKAQGLAFGEQPGEVYAVLDEAYKAASDKIPAKVPTEAEREADKESTLRQMLTDERDNAEAAMKRQEPEASANMPGASRRLAEARERQQRAQDDLAIFEADTMERSGGQVPENAAAAITEARARRQSREQAATAARARAATAEALRSYTR